MMMPIYSQNKRFTLHEGDNRDVLKELADNSIDSIVTDPPYELGFMGKSWDASGIAFNVEVWQECLRVLKPGGHLLAFSGSRTYHRMAVAIEDAGFEMRDQIMWIYGSGFPKSLDVEKAINKIDGVKFVEKPASGVGFMNAEGAGGYNVTIHQLQQVGESSERAKQWQGWGTALKPAHEPIVVARKPLIGTVAANVLTYGTGGLNIDGTRVGSEIMGGISNPKFPNGSSLVGKKEDVERTELSEKIEGRWPANVIHDGSDEVVELFPNTKAGVAVRGKSGGKNFGSDTPKPLLEDIGYGDSGTAARFFYCAKASKRDRNEGLDGFDLKTSNKFAQDKWTLENMSFAKTQPQANHHPTVKPTSLMQYLCKLVTPPGGVVLDPFAGSGSTGKAAMYEGFNFIGIEMTEEYLPIAKARIEFAIKESNAHLPIHL